MNKELINYIICPNCRSEKFIDKKRYLYCSLCKSQYPIKNNILILIKPKKQKQTLNLWEIKGEYKKLHEKRINSDKKGEATSPRTLKELKSFVNNKSVILNVGSGSGQYLKSMKGTIISFDIIPYFIKQTARKFTSPKYIFLVADANDFPFKKNIFDIIFSSQVIEHFEEKASDTLLKNMINSTKDKVLIDTPNDGNFFIRFLRYLVYRNESMEHQDAHLTHHRLIGRKDLERFGFETHGCVGFVTRRRFNIGIFWDLYDFLSWRIPSIGGNLIGIYKKKSLIQL